MNEGKLSNVTKEELEELIFEEKLSYEEIGRKYGVSGGAIKKRARKLGIELPKRRNINSNETFNKGKAIKYSKEDLENYLNQGKSYKEIGEIYGVSSSTIQVAVKRFNLKPTSRLYTVKEKIYSIDDTTFTNYVHNSTSISEIIRLLNLNSNDTVYKELRNRINELKLDTSHFINRSNNWIVLSDGQKIRGKSLDKILVKNSTYKSSNFLKYRLFNSGLKERKCECCGLTEWNGKPAPLELHHIDGDNTNNSFENLQILCPNCHAQTINYCSKNWKYIRERENKLE